MACSIGSILAADVSEHVPHFERNVAAMVKSLKPGCVVFEQSPFAKDDKEPDEDQQVHLSSGGITMEQAMGPSMVKEGNFWRKMKRQTMTMLTH